MGTPAFAVPTLRALASEHEVVAVATQPDRRKGRGQRTAYSRVKEWALGAGAAVEQPQTLRSPESQQALAAHGADVFVVAAYGLILPAEVLRIPPQGCINVHASLLPRHRGAAPIARAILEGDTETGITTMLMDEGLDTGPMLLERAIPIGPRETAPELTERLAEVGAELILETLRELEAGRIQPRPQDNTRATLAPSFKKEAGSIDWRRAPVEIDRQVRALQPWPRAFTFWRGERLTLWQTEPLGLDDEAAAEPGTVVRADVDGIRVACGAGELLRIDELQRPGARRQPAVEFIHGRPLPRGERFGQEAG